MSHIHRFHISFQDISFQEIIIQPTHNEWGSQVKTGGGIPSVEGIGTRKDMKGHEMASSFEEPQHSLDHEVWEVWWRMSGKAVMGWGDKSDCQELHIVLYHNGSDKDAEVLHRVRDELDLCGKPHRPGEGLNTVGRKTEKRIAGFWHEEWTVWWPH